MGLSGVSIWQLGIILLIVIVIFGTGRLKSLGSDLGGALKGFRKAMQDEDEPGKDKPKRIEEPAAQDAEFREADKAHDEAHDKVHDKASHG